MLGRLSRMAAQPPPAAIPPPVVLDAPAAVVYMFGDTGFVWDAVGASRVPRAHQRSLR